jgi:hypothetical protein
MWWTCMIGTKRVITPRWIGEMIYEVSQGKYGQEWDNSKRNMPLSYGDRESRLPLWTVPSTEGKSWVIIKKFAKPQLNFFVLFLVFHWWQGSQWFYLRKEKFGKTIPKRMIVQFPRMKRGIDIPKEMTGQLNDQRSGDWLVGLLPLTIWVVGVYAMVTSVSVMTWIGGWSSNRHGHSPHRWARVTFTSQMTKGDNLPSHVPQGCYLWLHDCLSWSCFFVLLKILSFGFFGVVQWSCQVDHI